VLGDGAMNGIELNIFSIRNLAGLNFAYDTYVVRNVRRDQAEYFQNRDHLVRTLSYKLKAPVHPINRNGELFLPFHRTRESFRNG
jgi:hypothetical protein